VRPPKNIYLKTEIVEELRQLIEETPSPFLNEIHEWLALIRDTSISISTIFKIWLSLAK
jgi:predicted DNA-binding protein (MmcQ/YjbR family)